MDEHLDGCLCVACIAQAAESGSDGSAAGGETAGGAAEKALYSLDDVVFAMTTSDGTFASVAWGRNQISYAIDTGARSSFDPDVQPEDAGYAAMSNDMEGWARRAFQMWNDVVAVELIDAGTNPNANILFNRSTETSELSYARYDYNFDDNAPRSTYTITDAEVWMWADDPLQNSDSDFDWSSEAFQIYLHEIGHALGLSHPGQYNISANFQDDATHQQDTQQYSVMSYFEAENSGADHVQGTTRMFASTPLLHDILTAQRIYGANMTTRTGDTVYGFNSNAGAVFDFARNASPVVAIWDAGGRDRIDVSGFSTAQSVDLREGAFSTVGAMSGNLAIAYGAQIEDATGGTGDDVLSGNGLKNELKGGAGDDVLRGYEMNDILFGGLGADTLSGGAGNDWAFFEDAEAAVAVSLRTGTGTAGEAAGDRYSGIERIGGSAHFDTLEGDDGYNRLIGFGGRDVLIGNGAFDYLNGSGGGDTLRGGPGKDRLVGGTGADRLEGGADTDWAQYDRASAAVVADLRAGGSAGEADGDLYFGVENLVGTAFGDVLRGDDGANTIDGLGGADRIGGRDGTDQLRGGAGIDTIEGGAGDDTLLGGPGADILNGQAGIDGVDFRQSAAGVDARLSTGRGRGGEAEGDTYINVESLFGSRHADRLEGNAEANFLRGRGGADLFVPLAGDDTLKGQGGADIFFFGDDNGRNRIIDFQLGVDQIRMGSGTAASFEELLFDAKNGNTVLSWGGPGEVVIVDLAPNQFSESDFDFSFV